MRSPLSQLHLSECPREKLLHLSHVLLDICLQMSCPRLPIVGGIAHSAGEEDKFVRIDRREDAVFGIATNHAETIDKHPDEEIGFAENLAVLPRNHATLNQGSERLHGVGGA